MGGGGHLNTHSNIPGVNPGSLTNAADPGLHWVISECHSDRHMVTRVEPWLGLTVWTFRRLGAKGSYLTLVSVADRIL